MNLELILDINIGCIFFLLLSMAILIVATKLRNGIGYLALVVICTTVPVFFSNLMRELGSEAFVLSLYIAGTLNVLCFPFLWIFVHSQLDRPFRFKPVMILHFLPALISLAANLAFYLPKSPAETEAEIAILNGGSENLPALVNDVILFGQYIIYFPCLLVYSYRRGKVIMENYSDADYLLLKWLPTFLWFFFILFTGVFVAYIIAPRTDVWLIPILDTMGMSYLIYSSIKYVPSDPVLRPSEETAVQEDSSTGSVSSMNYEQMQEICRAATDYLTATKSFLNPEITLASLAKDISVTPRNLSRSINSYMNRNFFEFINTMRVEYVKERLMELSTTEYNIDSIYSECGFRSRSSFFQVFKKITGKTPAAWLADTRQ